VATTSRTLQLGGDQLDGSSHVCALFEGPDEASDVLRDFIAEGIAQGERVVHIVEVPNLAIDRARRDRRLAGAVDSGQLTFRGWSETYLVDGRFRTDQMIGLVRELLEEGATLGYPATRAIGEMEWALDAVPGVADLIAYEQAVGAVIAAPNAVVCAYDMQRHSASRITAVVATHEAVFSDGHVQRPASLGGGIPPRSRILRAAARLFPRDGVRATGIDAVIQAADVAKATFYRQFRSKDDLIVAWLEDPRTRWFERLRARAELRASSPGELVPELFTVVAEWLVAGDYRGCPYLNVAVEISDPEHKVAPVIGDYLREIERNLQEMLRAAGYRAPEALGSELQVLLAGSISLGVAHRTDAFASQARDAAIRLLATAGSAPRRRRSEASPRPDPAPPKHGPVAGEGGRSSGPARP
jgi:AcrR family transcriptional regulator